MHQAGRRSGTEAMDGYSGDKGVVFGGINEEETPAQNVECWEGGSRGTWMLGLGRKAVREKILSTWKA